MQQSRFPLIVASLVTLAVSRGGPARAQQPEKTFDDILALAQKAPNEGAIQDAEAAADQAVVDQAKGTVLPQINLQSRYSRIDNSQQTALRMGARERIAGRTFDWSLTLSQPLFSFGRFTSVLAIADLTEGTIGLKRQAARDQFTIKVLNAYGDALLARAQKRITKNSAGHLQNVLALTKIEAQGGSRDKIDLLRAEAAHLDAVAGARLAAIREETTLAKLKILVDIPADTALLLSEAKDADMAFLTYHPQDKQLPRALQLLQKQAEIAREQVYYEKSFFYPSFALFASVSGSAFDFSPSPLPAASPSDAFSADNRDYAIGVQLDWNLFAGLETINSMRGQKASARKLELQLARALAENEALYQESQANFNVGRERFQASDNQRRAAQLFFERSQADYRSGTLQLSELLRAEQELREAEAGHIRAWLDWLFAAAALRMAGGESIIGDAP